MTHEVDPRPGRSSFERVVDALVWLTCIAFALAVAASYLAVAL